MEEGNTKKEDSASAHTKNKLNVPIAIVAAGALIAGAVFFSNKDESTPRAAGRALAAESTRGLDQMRAVTSEDHLRGNPSAKVVIVEYSDMECPFCKGFHSTLKRVMDEYGKDGKVAWVYRHFPLDSIHSKARSEAVATECAAEGGGDDAFWRYLDRFFELTPSNNQTDIQKLVPQIAREIGLNENRFNACLTSGTYDNHVQDNLDDAMATGGNGTPWSIVIAKNGKKYPLSGSQPYEAVQQLIELALQEK